MVQRILQTQPHARQHPGACPVLVAGKPPWISLFTNSGLGSQPTE
jgi:hypothetical protein